MSLPQALHLLGAGAVLGIGLFALLRPEAFARAAGLGVTDAMSVSEVRAGFGGLLTGLAVFSVYLHDDLVYAALGAGFLGATASRWLDLAGGLRDGELWSRVIASAAIAVLLLFPN